MNPTYSKLYFYKINVIKDCRDRTEVNERASILTVEYLYNTFIEYSGRYRIGFQDHYKYLHFHFSAVIKYIRFVSLKYEIALQLGN